MMFRVRWRGRPRKRSYQPLVERPDLESFAPPESPTPQEEPEPVDVGTSDDFELGKGAGASLDTLLTDHEESGLEAQLEALAPRVSWTVAFDPFETAREAPDRDEILERFVDLERAVHALLRGCARRMAQSEHYSGAHDISEIVHGSLDGSAIFHTLLSIYTKHVYARLLCPTHEVWTRHGSSLQKHAQLDTNTSSIEAMSRRRRKASLLYELRHSITAEVCNQFNMPPGHPGIPDDFSGCLRDILLETHTWNESAHWEDADGIHGFHAFLVEPSSHWDPDTMKAFECTDPWADPSTATISPVSFGLKDNDIHSEGSPTVVRKVKVLLYPIGHRATPPLRTPTIDTGTRSANSLFASEPVDGDTRATSPQLDADGAPGKPFVTSGDTEKLEADKSAKKHGRVRRWFRKVVKGKS